MSKRQRDDKSWKRLDDWDKTAILANCKKLLKEMDQLVHTKSSSSTSPLPSLSLALSSSSVATVSESKENSVTSVDKRRRSAKLAAHSKSAKQKISKTYSSTPSKQQTFIVYRRYWKDGDVDIDVYNSAEEMKSAAIKAIELYPEYFNPITGKLRENDNLDEKNGEKFEKFEKFDPSKFSLDHLMKLAVEIGHKVTENQDGYAIYEIIECKNIINRWQFE